MAYKGKSKRTSNRDTWIVLGFMLVVLLIIGALIFYFVSPDKELPEVETVGAEMPYDVPGFTILKNAPYGEVNDTFKVLCMGTYSGAFVEDGTDEQVTDVLSIVVTNTGDCLMEYGLITVNCGETTATFEFTGLPAAESVLVMEKNRTTYDDSMKLSDLTCVQYAEPSVLVMDFGNEFAVYSSDGFINIENISGRNFQSDVSLFYKNSDFGLFIGGITYRARFSGGIMAGETKQCMQQHYSAEKSVIMYMSYEQ